jgi:hypothetical protein
MKFFNKLVIICAAMAGVQAGGATVSLKGNQVAILGGFQISFALGNAIANSGRRLAELWATQIYDAWRFSSVTPATQVNTLWSTEALQNGKCVVVDALYTFRASSDAQKFATFANAYVNNKSNKREMADVGEISVEYANGDGFQL